MGVRVFFFSFFDAVVDTSTKNFRFIIIIIIINIIVSHFHHNPIYNVCDVHASVTVVPNEFCISARPATSYTIPYIYLHVAISIHGIHTGYHSVCRSFSGCRAVHTYFGFFFLHAAAYCYIWYLSRMILIFDIMCLYKRHE